MIKRSKLVFRRIQSRPVNPDLLRKPEAPNPSEMVERRSEHGFTVLVINSSQAMAKEITIQLSLDIPGCLIMYAPTIELAKWLLSRRDIDLVVSSDILPDGNIFKLQSVLRKMKDPPDMVVVGNVLLQSTDSLEEIGYHFSRYRCLSPESVPTEPPKLAQVITDLGQDIRHHLNNPLQAIVAMAFVAQSGKADGKVLEQALDSIEKVAKNMSTIVNGLEEKIRDAVEPLASNR